MSEKCKHGWISPPECLACVIEERAMREAAMGALEGDLEEAKADLDEAYRKISCLKVALEKSEYERGKLRELILRKLKPAWDNRVEAIVCPVCGELHTEHSDSCLYAQLEKEL